MSFTISALLTMSFKDFDQADNQPRYLTNVLLLSRGKFRINKFLAVRVASTREKNAR